jgi:copper chaperone CopZ
MSTVITLFQVPGVTCGYCKNSLETALRPIPGVAAATVSLADKTVTVTSDPDHVECDSLAEAIEDCGYDVADAREVSSS